MKKGDYILGISVVLVAFLLLIFFGFQKRDHGEFVTIQVKGKIIGKYSLWQDREIPILEHNTVVIESGTADMTDADCPDLLCVKQRPIEKTGETIICLPNQVVVKIEGKKQEDSIDAIVN